MTQDKYPLIEINKEKLFYNINYTIDMLHTHHSSFTMVVKGICCNKLIMDEVVKYTHPDYLATSRVSDMKKLKDFTIPKFLIRSSMPCEIKDIIRYTDISFESSIETLMLLDEEAKKQNKVHEIVLAIDLGDLREGIFYTNKEELFDAIQFILNSKHLSLKGVGTNLGCLNRVKTDLNNMNTFIEVVQKIEKHFDIHIDFLSALNTAGYELMEKGLIPSRINNARFGEAWITGHDGVNDKYVDSLYKDTIIFKAQIIELKDKPSLPIGEIRPSAHIELNDRGIIKRAIVACGHQEIDIANLVPLDESIKILGCSSDHTVLDLSNCKTDYKIGDVISFIPRYKSLLRMFSSNYVHQKLV